MGGDPWQVFVGKKSTLFYSGKTQTLEWVSKLRIDNIAPYIHNKKQVLCLSAINIAERLLQKAIVKDPDPFFNELARRGLFLNPQKILVLDFPFLPIALLHNLTLCNMCVCVCLCVTKKKYRGSFVNPYVELEILNAFGW